MNQSKQKAAWRFENEENSFEFYYDGSDSSLQIFIKSKNSYLMTECKYSDDGLPSEFKAIFESSKQLFEAITKTPNESFNHVFIHPRYYLVIQFLIATRLKKFLLPLYKNNAIQMEAKDKIEKVCLQNRRLTIQNDKKSQRIRQLQAEVIFLKNQLKQNNDEYRQMQQEINTKRKQQRQIEFNKTTIPQKTTCKIAINSSEYNQTLRISEKQIFNFKPLVTTFTQRHFNINDNIIKIVQQNKDFYQVVSSQPLSMVQRSLTRIRLIKSTKNSIYFGVMKEARRRQKYTCQHKQAIAMKLSGGKFLFEDSKQSGEQITSLKQGQVLNLLIDPIKKEMCWFVQKRYMIKRSLLQQFAQQSLYPFVSMHDLDDQIEFI